MNSTEQLFVRMALDAWNREINATDALLAKLSDEQLMREIVPGRNRGIYLLGHLAAENDQMLPLLRFQQAMHTALHEPFINQPDKAVADLPPLSQLRAQWKEVNAKLMEHIAIVPAEEWFTRHANITEADFPQEPHRNRLNVLISRTNHLAYHRGQLMLLQAK